MKIKILTLVLCFMACMVSMASAEKITPAEAQAIAKEAYIYGYPLVTLEMTRRRVTNVATVEEARAPMGQFAHMRKFPNAEYRDVPGANVDTLYSLAWLDLAKEPYVLSLPDEGERYFMMPLLSAWSDVFEVPGSRTTGNKAQKYALTGPGWTGSLPDGVKQYKSPTSLVWILGRTYCTGAPDDYKAVHSLQDQYSLVPLSAYGKPYTPPVGKIDSSLDMTSSVTEQVNQMEAEKYFNMLAALLKDNPPATADAPIVEKMVKIGIVPGKKFDLSKLDPAAAQGVRSAPEAALGMIMSSAKTAGKNVNGWLIVPKAGLYGTDYLLRAYVNALGPGWNRPEDAVYPISYTAADGKPYDGANKYVLRFPKGQTPPVKGFWSLTMYDSDKFLAANPLNRYAVGSSSGFKYNADGSLDIYIQRESPGRELEPNWLPAPAGKFGLMLRLYWPPEKAPTITDGSWQPPAVMRVQ